RSARLDHVGRRRCPPRRRLLDGRHCRFPGALRHADPPRRMGPESQGESRLNRLTYRAATATNLPFIVGLVVADTVGVSEDDPTAADPAYADALAAIDADPNQEMWIAELDDGPVGCFQLTYIPGLMRRGMWRGQIESVHIAPQHRNAGLGTEMMQWAVER